MLYIWLPVPVFMYAKIGTLGKKNQADSEYFSQFALKAIADNEPLDSHSSFEIDKQTASKGLGLLEISLLFSLHFPAVSKTELQYWYISYSVHYI